LLLAGQRKLHRNRLGKLGLELGEAAILAIFIWMHE
jgi:hypothetical protein